MLTSVPRLNDGGGVDNGLRAAKALRAWFLALVVGRTRTLNNRLAAQRCAAALLIAAIGFVAGAAIAQTKPEDLPPPPGALERELSAGLLGTAARGDNALAGGASALSKPVEIPFIIEGGHLIIEASIGGGAPRPFMFDTGASHLITPDVAEGLKAAPVVRTSRVGGFGSKVSFAKVIKVDRITIGPVELEQQNVTVVEVPNHIVDRGSRPRLAGLIGSELLLHYAVTIDYARRTLILNAPGFKPRAAKFSLPLTSAISLDGLSHPAIPAEIDGVSGDFIVDTGANGQVSMSEKFQSEHRPFANIAPVLHLVTPGGIGGRTNVRMGFGKQVRIGPSIISPPLLSGIDPGNSSFGRSPIAYSSGVIGNVMLANFVVTIDMPSARAYFEPVDRPHPATLYGVGFSLDKPDHDSFEVIDVLKDTAADRAGLRRGDRLIAIGGHPARDLALADVHGFSSTSRPPLMVVTADNRRLDLNFSRLLP